MLSYAILRYHVFGAVAWSQLPLFTVNKAVAFTAAFLLCLASLNRGPTAGAYGKLGYAACLVHAAASLAMLSPGMFPTFFDGVRLSFAGQMAVLAGLSAAAAFAFPAITSFTEICVALGGERVRRYRKLCTTALAVLALHLTSIGAGGWFDWTHWPAALPPITLIAFALVGATLTIRLIRKRRGNAASRPSSSR
jgi:hypothetical protein